MANTQRDPQLEARWRDVLDQQRSSGLTVQSFCRREGLGESSFYFWRRTIAGRDAKRQSVSQSPPRPADSRRDARGMIEPAFVPVTLAHVSSLDARHTIMIELRGGRTLRLPESISVTWFVELVHALEAEPRS